MKFRHLKIDFESKTTYNCHAAKAHNIDFEWLKSHSGQLFNTDVNVHEREQMLVNERNASCEQHCWTAEDHGAISPRIYQHGQEKTLTDTRANPTTIDVVLNGDCNLTCSYCCKEFSSAWRRDIANGEYKLTDYADSNYKLSSKDKVLMRVSQGELKSTEKYNILLNELKISAPHLTTLAITGGEPLLDNSLISTLTDIGLPMGAKIDIFTGLGVSSDRLRKLIGDLEKINNKVTLFISAENTDGLFEFNRYGNKWADFVQKVEMIRSSSLDMVFNSTLTNLTIFDFHSFYNLYKDHKIQMTFAYNPSMMAPYVMDSDSKQKIIADTAGLPEKFRSMIIDSISSEPTELQRLNTREFLVEFTRRRKDLQLGVYPNTFLKWLGLDNVV